MIQVKKVTGADGHYTLIEAKKKALEAKRVGVIHLGRGNPDLTTPKVKKGTAYFLMTR
jgi:hypothetical protein